MSLFDEMGQKISTADEGAMGMERSFDDTASLNTALSEEEKKIDDLYTQTGKLYYALHSQDYEEDFDALIVSITSSCEKIESIKKQIQDIKAVKRCESCGAKVPNDSSFCNACGSPLKTDETVLDEGKIKCENCGAVLDKNMSFCTSCGQPLVTAAVKSNPEPKEEKSKNTCPSCGAVVNEDLNFCTSCGQALKKSDVSEVDIDFPAIQSTRVCPLCGTVNDYDHAYCVNCGENLNKYNI